MNVMALRDSIVHECGLARLVAVAAMSWRFPLQCIDAHADMKAWTE